MDTQFILVSILLFWVVIILLVIVLLVAKNYLLPSGKVNLTVNEKETFEVGQGGSLLTTLSEAGVHLPSACGGKGSCGQCKCRVLSGGGEILDVERPHFSRKEIMQGYRLGCQCKVKGNIGIEVPDSVLGVKEWECTVISNKNVATYIKEFIVALPEGEHMDFIPGSYAQIRIPEYEMDYDRDIDKALIGEQYIPSWQQYDMFSLKCKNSEPTIRAYSMANYPAEGDRITLNVRIATPPFLPRPLKGFQPVSPGIASSYIFSLKPGDKVLMSGPYGDFHPLFNSHREMIYIGGGAGMAPLRSHLLHLLRTLHVTDRRISYWYGARSMAEVFYWEDFQELEKEFPNFSCHLALSAALPEDNWTGPTGFIHQALYDGYLKDHPAPEDVEYYMCGPGPMSNAAVNMLLELGVERSSILYDDFGG